MTLPALSIRRALLLPYVLPLRHPWRSARGVMTERRGWLVCLEAEGGLTGYGDCAPLPEAGTESYATALARLQAGLADLPDDVAEALTVYLDADWMNTPAARCAIETALVDLLAQQAGVPLARWLNSDAALTPQVNAVIGALDEGAVERADSAIQQGYAVIKAKVGVYPPDRELATLRLLPAAARLRLDANGAWDAAAAQDFVAGLAGLSVEALEEPLVTPTLAGLQALQGVAGFPLALDESLRHAERDSWVVSRAVRRLVLKPALLGGPLAAYTLACRARQYGWECVATTTLDSAVGVWAACHLAAALNNDLAHGLATAEWLAKDVGNLPHLAAGRVMLDNTVPGLGFCAIEQ